MKKKLHLNISEETYRFFERQKEKTGASYSETLEKIVMKHQMESEDFMEQLSDVMMEKLKPFLVQLRTIGNETNVVSRTNKEILNYMLLADNYIKEFEANGKDKDHLVTINAHAKVRSQINYQRQISIENQKLKNKNQ